MPYNLKGGETPGWRLLNNVKKLEKSLGGLPAPVDRPFFIVMSGLPGTGKSYLSRRIAEKLPVVILESDILRKALFSMPRYSGSENAQLFPAIHYLIEKLLKQHISVILDATNLNESFRKKLYNIARRTQAKLIIVKVDAPPELVWRRLETRRYETGSRSDADWEVYQAMKLKQDEIKQRHYVVDTARSINPVIRNIVRAAKRWKEK